MEQIGDKLKTKATGGLIELLKGELYPLVSTNMASKRDEGPHPASFEDEEV